MKICYIESNENLIFGIKLKIWYLETNENLLYGIKLKNLIFGSKWKFVIWKQMNICYMDSKGI